MALALELKDAACLPVQARQGTSNPDSARPMPIRRYYNASTRISECVHDSTIAKPGILNGQGSIHVMSRRWLAREMVRILTPAIHEYHPNTDILCYIVAITEYIYQPGTNRW